MEDLAHMINHFYLFTKENRPLFQLYNRIVFHYDEWKKGGVHLLSGDSGCGKTTLLRMFCHNFQKRYEDKEIVWYTYEEVVSIILCCIQSEHPIRLEQPTDATNLE